jgi:hypothetical protein
MLHTIFVAKFEQSRPAVQKQLPTLLYHYPLNHQYILQSIQMLPIDIKPFIVKYILKRWQDSWDQQIHNKLHEMHSLVGKTPCSYGQNRKEQVVVKITSLPIATRLL